MARLFLSMLLRPSQKLGQDIFLPSLTYLTMFTADHGPAGKSPGVEQTADWTENFSCPTGDMDSEPVYRVLRGYSWTAWIG